MPQPKAPTPLPSPALPLPVPEAVQVTEQQADRPDFHSLTLPLVRMPSLTARASSLLLGTFLRRLDLVWVVFGVWAEDCLVDYREDHQGDAQEGSDVQAEFYGSDSPRRRDYKSVENGAWIPSTILDSACGVLLISSRSSD